MATFVNEHVNTLNKALFNAFQPHIQALPQERSTASEPESALQLNDKQRFLSLAAQRIDLSSQTSLPSLQQVKSFLEQYTRTNDFENHSLELLLVAKSAVAIYGSLLDTILNSTLPISQSLSYWNGVYGSRLNEGYYALQTAPARVVSLATRTVDVMRTTQLGLKPLLQSPDHILNGLFPLHNHSKTTSTRQIKRVNLNLFAGEKLLVTHLIHQEIGHKRKMLNELRTQQAKRLGFLVKLSPTFSNNQDGESLFAVAKEIIRLCRLMEQSLKDSDKTDDAQVATFDIQSAIDAVEKETMEAMMSPKDTAQTLLKIIDTIQKHCNALDSFHQIFKQPSTVTRYWIPTVFIYFIGNTALKYVFQRKEEILAWIHELGDTAKAFAINWIWQPMLQVWDTIRLKDQRLGVLSKEGLRSDLDSLERMVVEFARDHYALSSNDTQQLMQNVRDGDLSLVLREYEKEIKHPLKNAVTGDLIQMLLIQVQKTKVDVDLAMAALDKLLKSNELNFAFLAVAPSMLLTWAGFAWLNNVFKSRTGRETKKFGKPIREIMRRIERLFDLASRNETTDEEPISSMKELGSASQGTLLCEVHLLRNYAHRLPKRNSIRELFLEDLRDLENPHLTIAQKLYTIQRMYRSWDFLQPAPVSSRRIM